MKKIIDEILANPGVSNWVKDSLRSGMRRDILDAAKDAKLLSDLLSACADEAIYGLDEAKIVLKEKGYKFLY